MQRGVGRVAVVSGTVAMFGYLLNFGKVDLAVVAATGRPRTPPRVPRRQKTMFALENTYFSLGALKLLSSTSLQTYKELMSATCHLICACTASTRENDMYQLFK